MAITKQHLSRARHGFGRGLLLLLALWLAWPSTAGTQDFKIIANPNVKDNELTVQKLRLFYLGKLKKWSNGRKVVLTYNRNKKELDRFSRQVVGKTSFQFTTFWKRQVFTGKGAMPKSFTNDDDLIDYVRNTSGAIGFISADTAAKGVITVKVTATSGWGR